MKNDTKWDIKWVLGIIFSLFLILSLPILLDTKLKVDQVWVYIENDDPFKKPKVEYRKIIEIKKGYVQYIENNEDTFSIGELAFKYNGNLVKK